MRRSLEHTADAGQCGIDWHATGTPISRRFGDPYYATTDGLAEARHVFLAGNGLPQRFRPGFRIAELGFGTGLNMLAALIAWREAGIKGPLRYTGFEAHPLSRGQTARALAAFPEVRAEAAPLLDALDRGVHRIETEWLSAEILPGDARARLPDWRGVADAWFLDGFAPARNPGMWEPGLLTAVAAHTAAGGTAATYTAAGAVRRALSAAGFAVERQPGFGCKRHMTAAWFPA